MYVTNCYRYIADIRYWSSYSNTSRPPSVLQSSRGCNEVSVVFWRLSESANRRQPTTILFQASLSGTLLHPSPFNVPSICERVWSKFQTRLIVNIFILFIFCVLELAVVSEIILRRCVNIINTSNILCFSYLKKIVSAVLVQGGGGVQMCNVSRILILKWC